jgi:hypothetical protein
MKQIKTVIVAVSRPSSAPGDLGRAIEQRFFIDNQMLALCDEHGNFVRDAFGTPYTAALNREDIAIVVAKKLALKAYRAAAPSNGDFHRPTSSIQYDRCDY